MRNTKNFDFFKSDLEKINRKHKVNLWIIIPFMSVIIICILVILTKFDDSFSIGSSSTVLGICLIFLGSIFLIGYNYYSIKAVDMKSQVNEATFDYLKNIYKQIKSKKMLLLITSLGFCIFLSSGIHVMVFKFFSDRVVIGILGLYYGVFAALYGYFFKVVNKKIDHEYGPIIKKIKATLL
ncbi:hypothetical protein [Sphingobacterium zeae]|uniref:Uncharacterized protein n=1 Tax=Sphingobacterium zeae TaxID=1776859 RepID=A0ABU0TZU1_9SPHI|nr:hypothetical protein [Sphingobacterium zeae]MDQ1148232.1 hypothetical protein [Sphingobacterium zeae]